jgi:ribonuclease HI
VPTAAHVEQLDATLPALPALPVTQTLPLRSDPAAIVYTDASKKPNSTGMGCGVYFPQHSGGAPRTLIRFAPGRYAHILKGELLAIWQALKHADMRTGTHLHILTDSLTSLYLLSRALHLPWTIQ